MTIRDAIDLLHGRKLYMSMGFDGNEAEWVKSNNVAIDMAIAALEKQEGKKPRLHPKPLKNEVFWWNCPHCGAHNHTNTMHNFCHHCGGRIDWGDEHGAD